MFRNSAGDDGSIRMWKVKEESDKVSAQLMWGYGGAVLHTPGAVLVNTVGLSAINRKLLKQRGAVSESTPGDESA